MPVHKIQGGGYQYGQTGKKYYGKDAKEKAERQALAIRLSGYEEPSKKKKSLQHESYLAEIGAKFVKELFKVDRMTRKDINDG